MKELAQVSARCLLAAFRIAIALSQTKDSEGPGLVAL